MGSESERESAHGARKQGRTLFFVVLATIVVLLGVFLVMRPQPVQTERSAIATHKQ